MSYITISEDLAANIQTQTFVNWYQQAGVFLFSGFASILSLHSGTIPSAETNNPANLLCNIFLKDGAAIANNYTYKIGPTTNALNVASAAGTATYFRLFKHDMVASFPNPIYDYRIVGSVSGIAGGGDLELFDTNITVGRPVEVFAFNITIPDTYTF